VLRVRRFVLTGMPGAGKTVLLRRMETLGYAVVEEAATDVIALEQAKGNAEPWLRPAFIDSIADLQRRRRLMAADRSGDVPGVQLYDRSPVCTLALCRFQGFAPTPALEAELARIESAQIYEKRVLFVRGLGFITRTEARQISFEDALRFETVHEQAYRELGFECVDVPPGTIEERRDFVHSLCTDAGTTSAGP
jgi:predicted ATPase